MGAGLYLGTLCSSQMFLKGQPFPKIKALSEATSSEGMTSGNSPTFLETKCYAGKNGEILKPRERGVHYKQCMRTSPVHLQRDRLDSGLESRVTRLMKMPHAMASLQGR